MHVWKTDTCILVYAILLMICVNVFMRAHSGDIHFGS
jgi:TRAP-type C4-dicarboxylate transport system permease small subunit